MNKKLTIALLVILILAIIAFMAKDLFFSEANQENPYEIKTDSLNNYDTSLVCYNEIYQIKADMDTLSGIAIDNHDNIITVGSSVIIYDKDFTKISSFQLKEAGTCVAVHSDGEIYIGIESHIEVWNMKGQFLRKWETGNPESVLTGIAVNDSSVFVADAAERVVHQYSFSGNFIKNFAEKDSVKGIPQIIIRSHFFDVSIGRDDEIWIVNPGKYSLEAFDKKGNLKSIWGKYSEKPDGFCGCCNPTNLTLLSDGSFVTSEKAIPRVKIYSQSGEFVCVVAGPDKFNEETKGLDLAGDSKNRIYVLDPVRKQIRIFEKMK